MQTLRVEYPVIGVVSIDVPDAVVEDKNLAKELVTQHFTRCSVTLCAMVGLVAAMLFSAILIYVNDTIVERRFAHRVVALEKQTKELEATKLELEKRVDTLLASMLTKEGSVVVEEAKKTINAQLVAEVDVLAQKRLAELKDRFAAMPRKTYPEGLQVMTFYNDNYGGLTRYEKINKFLNSQDYEQIVDIDLSSWDILYIPKK